MHLWRWRTRGKHHGSQNVNTSLRRLHQEGQPVRAETRAKLSKKLLIAPGVPLASVKWREAPDERISEHHSHVAPPSEGGLGRHLLFLPPSIDDGSLTTAKTAVLLLLRQHSLRKQNRTGETSMWHSNYVFPILHSVYWLE